MPELNERPSYGNVARKFEIQNSRREGCPVLSTFTKSMWRFSSALTVNISMDGFIQKNMKLD